MPSSEQALRAMSPLIQSVREAYATNDEEDEQTRLITKSTALQSASTVDEVLAMVPADYRDVLRTPLMGIAATVSKLMAARSTLAKWKAHQGAGTFPSFVSGKKPSIQLTKEYDASDEGQAHHATLTKAWTDYCALTLSNAIRAKEDDIKFLTVACELPRIQQDLFPLVAVRGRDLMAHSKIPVYSEGGEPGEINLDRWVDNPATARLAKDMRSDTALYAFRVLALVEQRELVAENKLRAKKAVKEQAEVEMTDVAKPGPSMQSIIDKQLNSRLKHLSLDKKSKGKGKVSATVDRYSSIFDFFSGQEEDFAIKQTAEGTSLPSKSRTQGPQGYKRRKVQGETQGQIVVREGRQGQGKVGQKVGHNTTLDSSFRYDNPSTYPDWMLTIPITDATDIVILNTPLNVIEASQFKSYIHLSTDVVVPQEIQMQLSVGMKYMLHSKRNSELIKSAWKDFEERIRWRLYFAFSKATEKTDLYDPDYEVPHTRTAEAPSLPAYLEHGLDLGRVFVHNTIRNIPVEKEDTIFKAFVPSIGKCAQFLRDNDLIVTGTDKNLGLAVSKRSWIDEKCLELLSDKENYIEIHPLMLKQELDSKCTEAEIVALLAEGCLENGEQIGKFLRHLITPEGETHIVPKFYGIPKIHKKPMKM